MCAAGARRCHAPWRRRTDVTTASAGSEAGARRCRATSRRGPRGRGAPGCARAEAAARRGVCGPQLGAQARGLPARPSGAAGLLRGPQPPPRTRPGLPCGPPREGTIPTPLSGPLGAALPGRPDSPRLARLSLRTPAHRPGRDPAARPPSQADPTPQHLSLQDTPLCWTGRQRGGGSRAAARSLPLGDQAADVVCVRSTATLDPHQAIHTPEEATGSYWAAASRRPPPPPAQQCVCLPSIFPSRLCRPGGSSMQGQPELGGAPGRVPPVSGSLSDLSEGAGEFSLHQASKGSGASEASVTQNGDDVEWDGDARISGRSEGFSTCTTSGLDPGEHSSAWGEFEGFRESSAKSEQFSQPFELQERPMEPKPLRTTSAQKERGSCQLHQSGPRVTGTAATSPSEPSLSYENVFRFAFQEVPVKQATEDVSTLDHFLEISSEEKPGLASVHKLCSESRKLWRALQNADTMLASRGLWSESHCQENFFLVLGIDAAQKNLPGGQGHAVEGSDHKEPEELGVRSFRLHHCRALIQTKLSGTPGGRQGSLITYSLFLKTPFRGNAQHITVPRKKIFTPRNLKMTLFNSDIC